MILTCFGRNTGIDNNKGILRINYNHFNLPEEMFFYGTEEEMFTLHFTYDALGNKLQKKVTVAGTIWFRSFQKLFKISKEKLEFFPSDFIQTKLQF